MTTRSIKWYRSLLTKKGRKKEGFFLVEGERQVSQLIQNHVEKIDEIIVLDSFGKSIGFDSCRFFTDKQMKQVLTTETLVPLVAVVSIGFIQKADVAVTGEQKVLFLEDVQDPGNVGTLIRSAVAFGFSQIIMTNNCADPFSGKVVRSTGGAIAELKIVRSSTPYELLGNLKEHGFQLVTADLNGVKNIPLTTENIIFALGNEGNGVSARLRTMSDTIYTIPFQSSKIESLNVAVAGAIGMSALYTGA